MQLNYFMGIDPDMHDMPMVILDSKNKIEIINIYKVPHNLVAREALVKMAETCDIRTSYMPAAIAIEGQEIYQFGPTKTINPKSIMYLATVAGIALKEVYLLSENILFPTPQEWKGSVPKQIHQARILKHIGWEYKRHGSQDAGYCVPTAPPPMFSGFKAGEWKHIVDAIGLALYAKEQYELKDAIKQANSIPGAR